MIGKNNLKNYKNLSSLKPSLKFIKEETNNQIFLTAYLYIHLDRERTPDSLGFDILGSMSASCSKLSKIDGGTKSPFRVIGTSAAYPGLGSLLYDCFMTEMKNSFGENGYLICDRSSITGEAENLYVKMHNSKDYEKITIKPSDLPFTTDLEFEFDECFDRFEDYLEALELGDPSATPSHINTAYQIHSSSEVEAILRKMVKNDSESDLSEKEINLMEDYGCTLGDSVIENREELFEEVKSGFADFKKYARKREAELELRI